MNSVKVALHSLGLWYDAADNQNKQSNWLRLRTKGIISHDRYLRGDYTGITTILK